MIQQFLNDLEQYPLNWHINKRKNDMIITIKIFYDYCEEIDHPLRIPLKYMIDNDKRPLRISNGDWMWYYHEDFSFHWRLPPYMNNSKFYTSKNYIDLLLKLKDSL